MATTLSMNWHPFTQMQTAKPPISIDRGKGAYLYAEDGKRYLDAISSWWVNLHGHTHPKIVAKLQAQAEKLEHVLFANFTHRPAQELTERLLPQLPGKMTKLFYSDNGSTSVEVAIKMALQYWYNQNVPKHQIVAFKNGYHGDTFGAMSVTARSEFNRPFWNHLFDVQFIDAPVRGREKQSLEQLQVIVQQKDVACFIFEPLIQGVGGMRLHSPEALSALVGCCKQHNVLTIADEVMTGFGRTRTLFACEQLTEKPDLICLSKGITGGFLPLGATACTEKIYEAFLSDRLEHAFLHGHSYTANPLACSCALASLELLLDEQCFAQRRMIENAHQAFCQKWAGKLNRCESHGTILVLEYPAEDKTYFSSLRDKLYAFFLSRGILLRPLGNVLYVMPPYCIKLSELEWIYETLEETLC